MKNFNCIKTSSIRLDNKIEQVRMKSWNDVKVWTDREISIVLSKNLRTIELNSCNDFMDFKTKWNISAVSIVIENLILSGITEEGKKGKAAVSAIFDAL